MVNKKQTKTKNKSDKKMNQKTSWWRPSNVRGGEEDPLAYRREDDDILLRKHVRKSVGMDSPTEELMLVVAFKNITFYIYGTKDGAIKTVSRGYRLVRKALSLLGLPELEEVVQSFYATCKSLSAMEKNAGILGEEIPALERFAAYEPALIQLAIKQAYPEGTAGKSVGIQSYGQEPTDHYSLIINGSEDRAVNTAFGRMIRAREVALEMNRQTAIAKSNRKRELELQIADARQAMPALEGRIKHIYSGLDTDGVEHILGGELICLDHDGQTPVAIVREDVNEESVGIPIDLMKAIVAGILRGANIPQSTQMALGVYAIVQRTVSDINAITNPPPAKPVKSSRSRPK